MTEIRAITLYQPFATFLALGMKTWETRSWGTNYRGLLAVHAGKLSSIEYQALNDDLAKRAWRVKVPPAWREPFPSGALLGVVQLVQVVSTDEFDLRSVSSFDREFGDFSKGRYMWRCREPVMLGMPILMRGHQRLWKLPDCTASYLSSMWDAD